MQRIEDHPAPASSGFISRLGNGFSHAASTCWNGAKSLVKKAENPAIVALYAVGVAGTCYGAGDLIVSYAGPSLWLLAAPITGFTVAVALRYRSPNAQTAAIFEKLDKGARHVLEVISRIGFHYLYFNRIAHTISGPRLTPAGVALVPVTTLTTAVMAHLLKEHLKDKENPHWALVVLSGLVIKPIDNGSALGPVFYIVGPENADVLQDAPIFWAEFGLTTFAAVNELLINRLSKNVKFVIDAAYDLMRGISRPAFLFSTATSLIALQRNDINTTDLAVSACFIGIPTVPLESYVVVRKNLHDYRERQRQGEALPLLASDEPGHAPINHDTATYQLPGCCYRNRQPDLLFSQPGSEDENSSHSRELTIKIGRPPVVEAVEATIEQLPPVQEQQIEEINTPGVSP